MPACPQCGITEWHTHDNVVIADPTPEMKSSQLLDRWEELQSLLSAAQEQVRAVAADAEQVRASLKARGIEVAPRAGVTTTPLSARELILKSDVPFIQTEDVESLPTSAVREVLSAAPLKEPKPANVSEAEQVITSIRESEAREEAAIARASEANLPFQRPVEVEAREDRTVAEIRKGSVEGVVGDQGSFAASIASAMQRVLPQ